MPLARHTFSGECGSGAFHSLGDLPERKYDDNQARNLSIFHSLHDHDSDNTSLEDHPQQPTVPLLCSNSSQSLPSPPTPSPSPHYPSTVPPRLPRGAAAPILLSNGQPLKPSLKSSRSMSLPSQRHHNHILSRSNSEPSSPVSSPKTVHFPERDDGLATVRIYNRSASPGALNNPSDGSADETETDGDEPTLARFSFPSYNPISNYEVDSTKSSSIPCKFSSHVNVLLESLDLVPSSSPNAAAKPFLTGFVLVRNLAFEKQVSIRFTLDNWQTVSEVSAHYVDSLPRLPSHIRSLASGSAWDDSALRRGRGWDRFAFIMHLEDYASPLSSRTLWLVSRYRVNSTYPEPGSAQYGPGGEWWDNNNGTNYHVEFKPAIAACPSSRPCYETTPGKLISHSCCPRSNAYAANSAPIILDRTQPQPPVTCKEQALGTMVPSVPDTEALPVRHTERDSALLCSGVRELNLRNYVPPAVRVMLSVSVPSGGFPPSSSSSPITDRQSLSLATLRSPCDEDSPSPVSSTLSTPSMSPTTAPCVVISEQIEISACLPSEHGEEDELKSPRLGRVVDWEWSAPGKPQAERLPDQQDDLSSVSAPAALSGRKGAIDNSSLLDVFVKQWCFAQGPTPTHGDSGILG